MQCLIKQMIQRPEPAFSHVGEDTSSDMERKNLPFFTKLSSCSDTQYITWYRVSQHTLQRDQPVPSTFSYLLFHSFPENKILVAER